MPRDLNSSVVTEITSNAIRPCFMAILTFKSQTVYAWSGVGNITYNGNTYLGVGSFGKISKVTEGTDVQAYGMSISLSGIDPILFNECLTDIQLGAPATIYFALLDGNGNIFGAPYPLFVGCVDAPQMQVSTQSLNITLQLETRLSNLLRSSMRRYTAADQNIYFPGDQAFNWVESLNDQALKWTA